MNPSAVVIAVFEVARDKEWTNLCILRRAQAEGRVVWLSKQPVTIDQQRERYDAAQRVVDALTVYANLVEPKS